MTLYRLFNGIETEFAPCKVLLSHDSSSPNSNAVKKGSEANFSILISSHLAITKIEAQLRSDHNSEVHLSYTLNWVNSIEGWDNFSIAIPTQNLDVGLYWISVCAYTVNSVFYTHSDGDSFYLSKDIHKQSAIQLTVYDRKYPTCDWLSGGIIYHIFVDRFARGTATPVADGAMLCTNWENPHVQYPAYPGAPLKNNQFFGGNLSGIIEKLPYLKSLGVSCLYLSPIFKAKSNHKYDTGDYMQIDPSFGDTAVFADLIEKANSNGMRIILDGVFNHTGDDSRYFNRHGSYNDLGAYQSQSSPYASWYFFKNFPDDYESWWGIEILPKLNLKAPDCRNYFLSENGVVAHYAKLGIGGMRLDVADELDDDFIRTVKKRLAQANPDNVLFGEVWEDASNKIAYGTRKTYYLGDELDGVMNYPLRSGILSFLKEGKTEPLQYALGQIIKNAPNEIANLQMNLLGSHDTERVLSALGDISFEGKTNDEIAEMSMTLQQRKKALSLLKMAYVIQATVPGIPSIYYGDEVGMEGYKDPFNRLPFPWHSIETDLFEHYQAVGMIRRENSVYRNGEFKLLKIDPKTLIFSRKTETESFISAINRSDKPLYIETDGTSELLLYGHRSGSKVIIPPMNACIFKTNASHAQIYSE